MHEYQSQDVTALAKALLAVQKSLQPAFKDAENPFIKSNYATLNSVMVACRDALQVNGIWMTQLPMPTPEHLGAGHLALQTKFTHASSGQWQASLTIVPLPKNDPSTTIHLGDHSKYIGLSDIGRALECPRAALCNKVFARPPATLQKLLTLQRGHWLEFGIGQALTAQKLNALPQLELVFTHNNTPIKAHFDFVLGKIHVLPFGFWNSKAPSIYLKPCTQLMKHNCTDKLLFSPLCGTNLHLACVMLTVHFCMKISPCWSYASGILA